MAKSTYSEVRLFKSWPHYFLTVMLNKLLKPLWA